jgi:putative addiction module component (TIGR02574 family)
MGRMTAQSQHVLREALSLPQADRADVIAQLLVSLEDANPANLADVQAAWAREIEARAQRVLAGQSDGEPWEIVRQRVARRLTEQ